MCSRHPEEGAGAEYFDPPPLEWRHVDTLAYTMTKHLLRQPVWVSRAQYGGWDHPKEEVSE